jgi:glucokinase
VTPSAEGRTLSVDLGGTHMRCAIVDHDGTVRHRREHPTPVGVGGPASLQELMAAVLRSMPCQSAVIGVPGRVDYAGGTLENAPNLPPVWVESMTEQALAGALGLPVQLANDADLAAVGEAWFGAGRPYADVVYLTLSTGVGAGAVLNGQVVHGRRSLLEIGHTIIDLPAARQHRPATLEELASGTGLRRLASEVGLKGTGPEIIAAVRACDPLALSVWDAVSGAAALGIVNVAWLFSPHVIVVGGGLGLVGDLLLGPARVALAALGPPGLEPPVQVVTAALGDDAGLVGAAAWARAFVPEQSSPARPATLPS